MALFDEWSSTGKQTYEGSAKTTAKWRSFRLDVEKPCTIGTLFHFAKEAGFSPKMIYAEVEAFEAIGGDKNAA